jgi:hypothetical protein
MGRANGEGLAVQPDHEHEEDDREHHDTRHAPILASLVTAA